MVEVAVKDLGEAIVVARTAHGMTQGELALTIGVSRPTVSAWENSKGWPDVREMRRLANVLGAGLWDVARDCSDLGGAKTACYLDTAA